MLNFDTLIAVVIVLLGLSLIGQSVQIFLKKLLKIKSETSLQTTTVQMLPWLRAAEGGETAPCPHRDVSAVS